MEDMEDPANRLDQPPATKADSLAVLFAMLCPTIVTLVYFQWLKDSGSSFQQIAYGIGKSLQFGFPIVWVLIWYRQKLKWSGQRNSKQIWLGVGFGFLVVAAMFAIYFLMIQPSEVAVDLTRMVKEKVGGMGLDSVWKYTGLGIFYALCHSFMEEYYWRWFVFDYLKKFTTNLAWQYDRTGRLLAPWISHMIVDAGIFALGYFLIRDML